MPQTKAINVQIKFINTQRVIMAKLPKYINYGAVLISFDPLDEEDIILNDETIVKGYREIDPDVIEVTHNTSGNLVLKFASSLYRDMTINFLREIFLLRIRFLKSVDFKSSDCAHSCNDFSGKLE
ncbi:hypothetical protein QE152_g29775 [Popillia japonica]|uniref:Uncharacterized protein n=1 Tax=Popillia japonica TaxID=7064 RepID=A0AAW1JHR3_POPJA